MWDNFWEVIKELVVFATQQILDLKSSLQNSSKNNPSEFGFESVVKLPAPKTALSLTGASIEVVDMEKESIFENRDYILASPDVMYVSNSKGAKCLNLPQLDFDCLIGVLPYGSAVTVIGYSGRYASINRSNINGWILKDDLAKVKNKVWPNFVNGDDYDFDNEDTIKLRNIIQDSFSAGTLKMPLTSGEYIVCRLRGDNRVIPWTQKRPRLPGAWHDLLRGLSGVHVGIFPKSDSIMEWQDEFGQGRLAYVELVSGDRAITISTIGFGSVGRYSEHLFTETQWKELRPVFIEVN